MASSHRTRANICHAHCVPWWWTATRPVPYVISVYLANWQIDAQVVHTISEAETALATGGGADGPFDVAILDMKAGIARARIRSGRAGHVW